MCAPRPRRGVEHRKKETQVAQIKFDGVEKRYGNDVAVARNDLLIKDGEFLTLLGPSGCGKTTTLRMIAGFVQPSIGRILMDEDDVTDVIPRRRAIGMVFQDYALFPHMTVGQNVGFGLRERKFPAAKRKARVEEMLELARLSDFIDRYPSQLSGGQQQRVALARALAFPPRVLLMDEPLGALDLKLRELMQSEIKRIHRELRVTTVYVTHDQVEAIYLSDRIAVMERGIIRQSGHPREIYEKPNCKFVAQFIGKINFLDATIVGSRNGHALVSAAGTEIVAPLPEGDWTRGDKRTLAVRPESIVLHEREPEGPNRIEGRVLQRSYSGNLAYLTIALSDGQALLIETGSKSVLPDENSRVFASWGPDDSSLLEQ